MRAIPGKLALPLPRLSEQPAPVQDEEGQDRGGEHAEDDPPEAEMILEPGHAADIDAEEAGDQCHGQEDRRDDGEHIEVAVGRLAEAAGDLLLEEPPALIKQVEILAECI